MSLTLRERAGGALGSAAAALATGITVGALGPFGTYSLLPLTQRLAFWVATIGINWLLLVLAIRQLDRLLPPSMPARIIILPVAASLMMVIPATAVVNLAGSMTSPMLSLPVATLAWMVFLVSLAISIPAHALRTLSGQKRDGNATAPATSRYQEIEPFLQRLDQPLAGRLTCIETQDHYLLVNSTGGQQMIHCRMVDAERELGDAGMRVHRSWWVAAEAVVGSEKPSGRDQLVLIDGRRVPVSRSHVKTVRQRGWI